MSKEEELFVEGKPTQKPKTGKRDKCSDKDMDARKTVYLYGFIALIVLLPIIIGYAIHLITSFETVTLATGGLWIFLLVVIIVGGVVFYVNWINVKCIKEKQPPSESL